MFTDNLVNVHFIFNEYIFNEYSYDFIDSNIIMLDIFTIIKYYILDIFSYKIISISKLITIYIIFSIWVNFGPINILIKLRRYSFCWTFYRFFRKLYIDFKENAIYIYNIPYFILFRRFIWVNIIKYIYIKIISNYYFKKIKFYFNSEPYFLKKQQALNDMAYIRKNKARVLKNHTKWLLYTYFFLSIFLYALSTYWWGLAFVTAYWSFILFGCGLKLVKFSYPYIIFYLCYIFYSILVLYLFYYLPKII